MTGERGTASSKQEATGRARRCEQQREDFGGKYEKALQNTDNLKGTWRALGTHKMSSKDSQQGWGWDDSKNCWAGRNSVQVLGSPAATLPNSL